MKLLQVSEPASLELAEAVRWTKRDVRAGARDCSDAVSRAFELIERHPQIGSERRTRPVAQQLKVRGFPYVVVYRLRPDDVYVVAVTHTGRRPGYWKQRA